MSDQLPIPLTKDLPELKNITSLLETHLPKLEKGHDAAVAAMAEITQVTNDEEREEAADTVVAVRGTYTKMLALRKELTSPLDDLKKKIMEYERPLEDSKDSEYSKLRNLIATYDQKKIDEKKRIEADAAKKKAKENHLVDIGTQILQNLNTMVLTKTKEADSKSKAYFDACTLENFDAKAETYKKMKPVLKTEDYSAAFKVPYDPTLITSNEFADIIATLKEVETYDKWNEEVVKSSTPIVNEWRSRIPQLKENLVKLKNAKDDAERQQLQQQQAAQAAADAERLRKSLEQQHSDQANEINSQAGINKLENSFKEQIAVQELGDTGPVKYVLKFTDDKQLLKAFTTIIYHVFASPKFTGIYKMKDGKRELENGKPVYIKEVQYWIDFFLKNCDADIAGTEVTEEAKVIIRK